MDDLLKTMPLPKDKEAWREWLAGTKQPDPVVPISDAELDTEICEGESHDA